MTFQDFLETTAAVPAPHLRRAMIRALAAEPARTPDARHRFYGRVVDQLTLAAHREPRRPGAAHDLDRRQELQHAS